MTNEPENNSPHPHSNSVFLIPSGVDKMVLVLIDCASKHKLK